MTTHRITFEGPAPVALTTARAVADADGIELTGSQGPDRSSEGDGTVVLVLTVDGTAEAVLAAVDTVRADLPPGATIAAAAGE